MAMELLDRPIRVSNQRQMTRLSEAELGGFDMSLQLPHDARWVTVRLLDFTSLGFGLHCPGVAPGDVNPGEGSAVRIRISLLRQGGFEAMCAVRNFSASKGGLKMGLRRLYLEAKRFAETERRDGRRVAVPIAMPLRARVKHPLLHDHWNLLTVVDVNGDMGLALQCSDPTLLVCEGMELDIHFELAGLDERPLRGKVAWVRALGNFQIRFGIVCSEIDHPLQVALCDFLLSSQRWSPERLRELGFPVRTKPRSRTHMPKPA